MLYKAISVRQPYAWAIIAGLKKIENRKWYSSYRGPLLIHAGKTRARSLLLPTGEPAPRDEINYGAIIGAVNMVDCIEYASSKMLQESPWACGPFCFIFDEPMYFPPIPHVGSLGIFSIDESVLG